MVGVFRYRRRVDAAKLVEPLVKWSHVFVVARNSEYRALKEFSRFMHTPDAPGMELPGVDIPGIAEAYGVQSDRVKLLSDLTHAIKDALSSDKPHLIEISRRRLGDS